MQLARILGLVRVSHTASRFSILSWESSWSESGLFDGLIAVCGDRVLRYFVISLAPFTMLMQSENSIYRFSFWWNNSRSVYSFIGFAESTFFDNVLGLLATISAIVCLLLLLL